MLTHLAHAKIQELVGFTDTEFNVLNLSNDWKKGYRKVLNLYRFNDHNYIEINNSLLVLGEILQISRNNT